MDFVYDIYLDGLILKQILDKCLLRSVYFLLINIVK